MNEVPDIPAGWDEARLRDFGEIVAGGTPSRANPSYWGGTIHWVTPGEITQLRSKYLTQTAERITQEGLAGSAAKLLPRGSVVVTSRATLGEAAIAGVSLATNQGFKSIIPNAETDSIFTYYVMGEVRREMTRLASGTTFLEISKSDFENIRIRRPKIAEQRRIAVVLDALDEAIAKTEAVIVKLKQVRAGLLHDLLTRGLDEHGQLRDPVAHPERFQDSPIGRIAREWKIKQLREVVPPSRRVTYGIVQPGDFDPRGVLLIRGQDYINRWASRDAFFRVARSRHESYRRSLTKAGDLLICIVGATTGAVAQVPDWIDEANITQTTARVACDEDKVTSRFGLHVLASKIGQDQVRRYLKGSAQPGLNLRDVELFWIPVPAVDEQRMIAAHLDTQARDTTATEQELTKLHQLKSGFMTDLLTGRVRVPVEISDV